MRARSVLATPLIMSPILHFLRDARIRTQRAAVAHRRATNLAIHLRNLTTHLPICTYLQLLVEQDLSDHTLMEAEPGAGTNDVFQPSLDLLQSKF
jgi:hypothetical protein